VVINSVLNKSSERGSVINDDKFYNVEITTSKNNFVHVISKDLYIYPQKKDSVTLHSSSILSNYNYVYLHRKDANYYIQNSVFNFPFLVLYVMVCVPSLIFFFTKNLDSWEMTYYVFIGNVFTFFAFFIQLYSQ